jgi:Tfp pilus assembly protein PilV
MMSSLNSNCKSKNADSRSGISLMEVLISIGIMAVGMVAIASLLPAGGVLVKRATIEERKAEMGLNIAKEFKINGFSDPTSWLSYSSAWQVYVPPTDPAAAVESIAIDPMMLSANPSNVAVRSFPANGVSGAPVMRRVSLKQCGVQSGTNYTLSNPLSELKCMMTNELVVDQPDDKTLPGTSHMMLDSSSTPLKRDYEGNYTWLATITFPTSEFAPSAASFGNTALLSIAVANARPMTAPTSGSGQEEMLSVDQPASGSPPVSMGGAEITAAGSTAQLDMLVPGRWVILCRYQQVPNLPSGTPRQPQPIFKWYRITNSSESSTSGKQDVTLVGPDWVWGDSSHLTYLCAFADVVAVYERSIHLEDPSSIWNQ